MCCFLEILNVSRNIFKLRKALAALEYAINILTLNVVNKCCSKCKHKVGHPLQRKAHVTSILRNKLYSNTFIPLYSSSVTYVA